MSEKCFGKIFNILFHLREFGDFPTQSEMKLLELVWLFCEVFVLFLVVNLVKLSLIRGSQDQSVLLSVLI